MQGDWTPWSSRVPQIEVETHMVAAPDLVIPTVDTVRHEALLYTWLAEHKPLGTLYRLRLKLGEESLGKFLAMSECDCSDLT